MYLDTYWGAVCVPEYPHHRVLPGDHIQHRLLPPAVGPGAGPPTYVFYTVPFSAHYGGSSCIWPTNVVHSFVVCFADLTYSSVYMLFIELTFFLVFFISAERFNLPVVHTDMNS